MEGHIFYGEDRVIEIMEEENKGWLFYVGHNTEELFNEYLDYCTDNSLDPTEESSASRFIEYRDKVLEESFECDCI